MMTETLSEELLREQILIGDVYHWELDPNGYFVIQENEPRTTSDERNMSDFVAYDLDRITERISDN
jgi:hypothetical protein